MSIALFAVISIVAMFRYLKQNLKFKRMSNANTLSTSNALEKIEEGIPSSTKSDVQKTSEKDDVFLNRAVVVRTVSVDRAVVRTVSASKNRENLVHSITCGDASKINPDIFLNDQIPSLPFIPNREMSRNQFSVGKMIGKGNFGKVYRITHPYFKCTAAVKVIDLQKWKDKSENMKKLLKTAMESEL